MRKRWTSKETWLLRQHYADTPTSELAYFFGCSKSSIYGRAAIHGLKKNPSFLKEHCRLRPGSVIGKDFRFKPGHRPHNKGKKGWSAGGNSLKSRFKKGNRPQTWVPVGSTRITKGGIIQRKITDTGYTPRDWKSEHSLLWESHNGPVPKGHIVVFKDGNPENIFIENLECITRAENMRRNSIHKLPKELAEVCRLKGVLNRHINKRMGKIEK